MSVLLQDSTTSSVIAIPIIFVSVSTLFIGVIVGVAVMYHVKKKPSSQHEQHDIAHTDEAIYEEAMIASNETIPAT